MCVSGHMCWLTEWDSVFTRTMDAYNGSCRSKHPAALMGRVALASGIARLVLVQRTVQKNSNVKSEPKYLACEESPICAFYFWTLSCSSVALFASTVGWLLCFFVSELPAVSCVQHSFLHLAPQIQTSQRASHTALPVLHSQETSSCNAHILSRRKCKLTFQCDLKLTFLSDTANWHF